MTPASGCAVRTAQPSATLKLGVPLAPRAQADTIRLPAPTCDVVLPWEYVVDEVLVVRDAVLPVSTSETPVKQAAEMEEYELLLNEIWCDAPVLVGLRQYQMRSDQVLGARPTDTANVQVFDPPTPLSVIAVG